jgi:hypothetical protein
MNARSVKLVLLVLTGVLFVSCSPQTASSYRFRPLGYYATAPEQTKIVVSLWDQKAWLLGKEGRVILETDVSTGVPGFETPEGVFPVLEHLRAKRSNRYGKYVAIESREVVIEKSWEHKGPAPPGTEYEGILMPHWMRLTWDGVGMHEGKFRKRYRASFGCIRVHPKAQERIFNKTMVGTEVKVVAESLIEQYSW